MTTSPLYGVVLVLHVLAAVVGFGALGTTGAYAAALRRTNGGSVSEGVARYFAPGTNRAARALLLVPLLGGALLALGRGRYVGLAWPWIGLALWTGAVAVASAVVWPGERRVQQLVAAVAKEVPDPLAEARHLARRVERGTAVTSLLFVAALVVMIWQPS